MTTKKMRVPPAEELLAQARAATLQRGTCGMCGHCGLNRTSGKFVDLCRNVASLQMGNPVPRNAPACPQYVERTAIPHGFVARPQLKQVANDKTRA